MEYHGKRKAIYQVFDEIEFVKAFFPIHIPKEAHDENIKRGAGSQQQVKVLVIVECKLIDTILCKYLSIAIAKSVEKSEA